MCESETNAGNLLISQVQKAALNLLVMAARALKKEALSHIRQAVISVMVVMVVITPLLSRSTFDIYRTVYANLSRYCVAIWMLHPCRIFGFGFHIFGCGWLIFGCGWLIFRCV